MKIRDWILLLLMVGVLGVWIWSRVLLRDYHQEPFTKIEERLYSGMKVPQPPPGTTVVVNVCGAKNEYPVKISHWRPIMDAGDPPKLPWLREIVQFVDTKMKEGETVFIHCAAGISRSGLVTTAYIMRKYNWSRDRALEYVRDRRLQIKPRKAFMKLLLEWESEIKSAQASDGR